MTAARVDLDIHDLVRELVEPHPHREEHTLEDDTGTTWSGMAYLTNQPSLIDQLLNGAQAGSGTGSQSGTVPHSRPELPVEALDTVMLIDDEAGRWVERLGENRPWDTWLNGARVRGSGTKACIRRTHALYPSAPTCGSDRPHRDPETNTPCCLRHRLEVDVRRWWQQARVVSGWDSPAYRPFNTCPVCEHRGGLRLNLSLETGLCVECRSIWTHADWRGLVMHIRIENDLTTREDED